MMLVAMATRRCHSFAWIFQKSARNHPLPSHRHPYYSSMRLFSVPANASFSATFAADISQEKIYKELQWISSQIRRHDALYYAGQPEIDDDAYDALARREEQLCQQFPRLLDRLQEETGLGIRAARSGGRVGADLLDDGASVTAATQAQAARFVKRKHLTKMLSLDNVHDTRQLLQWLGRVRKKLAASNSTVSILTEPKLDGLSCSIRYERNDDGDQYTMQWAATRGDGAVGQDVTVAMRRIPSLPTKLKTDYVSADKLEVRGEVILPSSAFASLRDDDTKFNFSNARNAASGILLRKEDDEDSQKLRALLQFVAYDIVAPSNTDEVEDDNDQALPITRQVLASWDFGIAQPVAETLLTLVGDNEWDEKDVKGLLEYYNALQMHRNGEKASLDFGDYEMDGCVHKLVDSSLRTDLGSSNRAPRWAIAHKFPAQAAVTGLQSVEIQVGRTGVLTPVACLDRVDLNGVTVQRATLHNFQHMQQTFNGRERVPRGIKVLVRRAGDVIPQVVAVLDPDRSEGSSSPDMISLQAPKTCPACGSPTFFDPSSVRNTSSVTTQEESRTSGQALRCGGPPLLCKPRAIQALQHAYSRDALDVKGLSEARIRQLMNESLINVPADLFILTRDAAKLDEVAQLPGWGNKSVEALAAAANGVVTGGVELSRFIYSLGIRGVGLHLSSLIADAYDDVGDFLRDLEAAASPTIGEGIASEAFVRLREDTNATKGIGPTALSSLGEYAKERVLLDAALELAKQIRINKRLPESISQSLSQSAEGPFQGKIVVFTGSLPDMTRSEAQKLARAMGAISTPSAVSKSTDVIVAGAKVGPKKLKEATDWNIPVMSMEEFYSLVNRYR